MGGSTENPTYQDVCSDTTGHIEVVHLEYDPAVVTYNTLLDLFWENHDPTSWDKQGQDTGIQYRSAIFYHTQAQATQAQAAITALDASDKYASAIVTLVLPATTFFRAEEYHQKYFQKKGINACPIL